MELDRFNRWLSLAANIGVIAGIIFLGVEIRQNTAATCRAASQEISNAQVDFFMRLAEGADLARVVKVATESPDELSEIEVTQYQYVTGAVFMLMEEAYKQYRLGFVPATGWEPYEKLMTSFLNNPISRS